MTDTKKIMRSTSNTKNSNLFQLINNSKGITLPQIVLLPNIKSHNETFGIKYKTFSKSVTRIASPQWILSVFVDQHFFYNNKSDEPLHVICFLQFSIEKILSYLNKNASCKITFRVNNTSAITNCSLKIGRPPTTCSAYFDLREINLSSPTWATISAELYFQSSEIITTSINQPSFVFNKSKPVNWTVVQTSKLFGKFALGLPITSIRTGTTFKMPLSISEVENLDFIKILVEYCDCLSFIGLENINQTQWEVQSDFVQFQDKDLGIIRLTSRTRNRRVDELDTERKWKEIGLVTFFVSEKECTDKCRIKAGISKVETSNGKSRKYFDKTSFNKTQKSANISIDSINMIMIVFPEPPHTTSVKWYSSINSVEPVSRHVYTYILHKSGDSYFPQLIKNVTCQSNQFSRGIANGECLPQKFSDSWVLSMQVEHWKTVVFNIFNFWQPESWKLYLSDSELNPISNWLVFRNNQCIVLYQSAVLKIGTRFNTFNSFGMKTYLGSSPHNVKPWIDMSKEIDISTITSNPPGVVSLSRNVKGTILVDVNSSRNTIISLYDKMKLLADTEVTVFSDHWVSVVRFIGRCISDLDINKVENHPSGEGQFLNYEMKLRKLRIGEKCHLYLGVVFDDKTQILLEDMASNDYRLEVNGIEFKNGNLVTYQIKINVILYSSSLCQNSIVGKGEIDLSSDLFIEKPREIIITTESSTQAMSISIPTKLSVKDNTSKSNVEQKNSLSIAIYCVIGVVAMALGILLLNCVIGLNVRRHSIANIQRRLSKSGNHDRQNKRADHMNSQKPPQDHYPPLLPPPGPIIPPNKPATDWAISSESGIGLEHSSLGSQQDGVALSTFRISLANGSMHPSDSSSYIHQTSPFNDVILESNNLYTTESPSPQFDPQLCINRSYWSGLNSNYRLPNHDSSQDYRLIHDHTLTSEHKTNLDLV